MCFQEGCNKHPNYNKQGGKPLYCVTHKLENMIDVKNKKCIYQGCLKQPAFAIEGDKALYCAIHKLENMVDVKHNKCIHEGCKKHPAFAKQGEKPLYCGTHKLEGMIDVVNKRCIQEGCITRPKFSMEGEKPLYCAIHKLENMVDVANKRCKTPLCYTQVHEKYNGYCLYCYMNLFPDKPVSRNYKTKEYAVVEHVKTQFPEYNWIADKIINGGCSKRRPDLILDLGVQVIIAEIDENQHMGYECSCENKRLMELSQDLGHRPIVFIRFNPDEYEDNGKYISSCWGNDKKGICVVKKSKIKEWSERLNKLEEQIKYWLLNTTNKTVEVIQLYYDI
jgi:EsV-1-7 cysteine-rich motif